MFRQIERWLHQHIFKVGWLLSNNFQVTTVLYYILFLPGIVLHEAALWLAAAVLNVRAERSIGFPEPQEIGELRLNFIRLAEDAGRMKRLIIRLCPVAAGMAALWTIGAHVFRWEELFGLTAEGSLDSLIAAWATLTAVADLWLWFYLAFVIANTMFPTLAKRSDRREKGLVLVSAPALAFIVWRLAGAVNPAVAAEIEALLGSIVLVIAQITLVNAAAVLILGAIEALTERVTGRSATFRDGKMLTRTRQEAREFMSARGRESRPAPAKSRSAPTLNSIYDLKLPIPGPPGREPVSRSAAAVVHLEMAGAGASPKPELAIKPAPPQEEEAASNLSGAIQDSAEGRDERPNTVQPLAGPNAPFARPFVKGDSPGSEGKTWREEAGAEAVEPFARPFVTTSGAGSADAEGAAKAKQAAASQNSADDQRSEGSTGQPSRLAVRRQSRTAPAPKPSQRALRESKPEDDGELEYEAFEDDMPYMDEDDAGDAARQG